MLFPASPIIRGRAVRRRRADAFLLAGAVALQILAASPAEAVDLFATHEVTAQFATPDGKPMANAEVRAFSPGDPGTPAVTGRTDAEGKFVFAANQDGFWSAEARSPDYVARVMIRVGAEQQSQSWLSPIFVGGFLVVMLAIAIWYRFLRARTHGPRP